MDPDNLTSDIDQLSLALEGLSAEISALPEEFRERLAHNLQQVQDCLQDHISQKFGEKFSSAFRSSPAALAISRVSDGLFVDVNESFCSAVGFNREEIVGHTVLELGLFVDPEEGFKLRDMIREQDSVRNYEIQSRARSGNILTMLFSMERFDMDGEPHVLATGIDITERKQMEESLRESQQKFQSIFQNAPFAIALTRAEDSVTVDVNQAFLELFGFEKNEVIGRTAVALGVVPDPEARARIFVNLGQNGFIRNQELIYRTKAGVPLIVSMNGDRLTIGENEYYLTAVENITERKRAENALKESEAALRESERALRASMFSERARAKELEALMDAVPAMIWVAHDPQCRVMVGNRAGLEILREKPDANVSSTAPGEVLARQCYHNMKDGRLIPTAELPMQVAAATGKPARNYTYDVVFDDGATYNLIGNVNPLFDPEGNPAGAVGAFVDITALRSLEAERVEAITEIEVQRRLMEQREQERQQIARDIHDGPIQTLVSAIFNLQITKEALPDRQFQIELNQIGISIKNAVQELRQVVNELRPPSILRFGLSRAILIHAEDFRERHPELELSLDLGGETSKLPEQISLVLFRIYQEALNNIIRHAEATRADVRLTFEGEQVRLEIKDNGKGFADRPDLVKQIERGHYGMAGMNERAEALDGRLEIRSKPGQGTAVRVTLPLEIE